MNKVKYFDHNVAGIDYVFGDLHGCLDEFHQLLVHVGFDPTIDRVFSVGDLADRGPKSKECIELIYEKWFHPVVGNHEQMMVESTASQGGNTYTWFSNGGEWSINQDRQWLETACEDLKNLPFVIVIGKGSPQRINIVHAELASDRRGDYATDEDIDDWYFNEYCENNMVWGRGIVQSKDPVARPELSTTYVGHTPVDVPVEKSSHRFIDTAAVYWYRQKYAKAKLTMVRLHDSKVYSLDMASKHISEFNFGESNADVQL